MNEKLLLTSKYQQKKNIDRYYGKYDKYYFSDYEKLEVFIMRDFTVHGCRSIDNFRKSAINHYSIF